MQILNNSRATNGSSLYSSSSAELIPTVNHLQGLAVSLERRATYWKRSFVR